MHFSAIIAALAATTLAFPLSNILPRQATCVLPGTTSDGLTGPFRLQVNPDADPAYANLYAGTIPNRAPYIVFQYPDPTKHRVQNLYLDSSSHLLIRENGITQYIYNELTRRHIALTTDSTIENQITCSIDAATCELNCALPSGLNSDCLASPKVSPEWRIGGRKVARPGCPAFFPVVVASAPVQSAA